MSIFIHIFLQKFIKRGYKIRNMIIRASTPRVKPRNCLVLPLKITLPAINFGRPGVKADGSERA
jgi:hypothetical protein